MPAPNTPLGRLIHAPVKPGRIEWIGLRPERRKAMTIVSHAQLDPHLGLMGDRYAGRSGERHVTLIQHEHLSAIASYLGIARVAPEQLRRNIVISGLNLLALKDRQFRLGTAVLEMTGECHPCSRMEEVFGPGGYNAVRSHGGINARVIEAGEIRIGDALIPEVQLSFDL